MPYPLVLHAPETLESATAIDDSEFDLDLRVVEGTDPLLIMMCDTSDGCGNSCGGSACSSVSNDPV